MKCKYLEGENIRPRIVAEAISLTGKFVEYLEERDIDKSGRGYYFPRSGVIISAKGREIEFDGFVYVSLKGIREMVLK